MIKFTAKANATDCSMIEIVEKTRHTTTLYALVEWSFFGEEYRDRFMDGEEIEFEVKEVTK